jgi:hypothetical protein
MNDTGRAVRPETLALDALIRETVTRAEASTDGGADTMLFLGNRHHAFPTAVIKDPVLEPVDKLVWMVIILEVRETGVNTTFPGYGAIANMANVSSRSTVARAIAILRATRWLTLCGRLRKASGRFRGNVYALHDEPLPLADAIHLDANYMGFLSKAANHGHARVRRVAQGVLASLEEDIQAGLDVCAGEHPVERRIQSLVKTTTGHSRRFFAFTRNAIRQLHHDAAIPPKAVDHRDQKSNSAGDRAQNSNAQNLDRRDSSSYINKKTTTTGSELSKFVLTGEAGQPLVYPRRLCDNHRNLANRYLRGLAPAQRQPVLDELAGRFRAEQKGMKPVYDEIRFLTRLCKLAKAGKFQPNLGIKVCDSRRARDGSRHPGADRQTSEKSQETEEHRQKRRAVAQEGLADMRKALAMPDRNSTATTSDDTGPLTG